MPELQTLDVALIDVDDVNPRKHVDEGKLAQLVASIREHGVIQPVIVRPDGDRYKLIAGSRRLRAAIGADLAEIPAVVRDTNGDSRAISVVENLQREDLNPIEEAQAFLDAIHGGMTPGELAKATSMSEDTIKARLQLLHLPAPVQTRVADRTLPLKAAAALEQLTPAGEAVIAKIAELVVSDDGFPEDRLSAGDVVDDPAWVLDRAIDELGHDAPFVVDAHTATQLTSLPWPDGVDAKKLIEKSKQVPEYDGNYRSVRREALSLNTADFDAARAYGCLLELPGRGGHRSSGPWVTDPAWLLDRLDQKLDAAIAKHAKKTSTKKKSAGATSKAETAEQERKEAERQERAAEKAKQLEARERNITLGIALTKELHAPAPTADNMRLVAEVLLRYAGEDLARRGLRFVDEAAHAVKLRKDGSISTVSYLRGTRELDQMIRRRVDRAKSPEQILGALLQLIVASRFAETEAAAQSDRHGAVRGLSDWSPDPKIGGLVEKVAAPVLPPQVVEALQTKREQERLELEQEDAALVSRIQRGEDVCPRCGNRPGADWVKCDCAPDEILAAIAACPGCGEDECFATCTAFETEGTA